MGTQRKSELRKKGCEYQPRGISLLQVIFERHFSDFVRVYEDAARYGKYRLERIKTVGEHFLACGDYLSGVARIRCTNPECGHDYFRPFSCKGFYLCPSCSQKRTILMAEHLTEEVLLRLSALRNPAPFESRPSPSLAPVFGGKLLYVFAISAPASPSSAVCFHFSKSLASFLPEQQKAVC